MLISTINFWSVSTSSLFLPTVSVNPPSPFASLARPLFGGMLEFEIQISISNGTALQLPLSYANDHAKVTNNNNKTKSINTGKARSPLSLSVMALLKSNVGGNTILLAFSHNIEPIGSLTLEFKRKDTLYFIFQVSTDCCCNINIC